MTEKTPEEIALERIFNATKKNSTKLDLSRLGLTFLPAEVGMLKNLTHLDLSNNHLTDLPSEIVSISGLGGLILSNNSFQKVPKCLASLVNLQDLELHGNTIIEFPVFLSKLSNLKRLNLSANKIAVISPEINGLQSLRDLFLVKNDLETLPLEFADLHELNNLNISKNRFVDFPMGLFGLKNLFVFRAQENNFRKIPQEIKHLVALQVLDLKSNQITEIPDEIKFLSKLRHLNISRNKLEALPSSIGELSNLKQLVLIKNKISVLPDSIQQLSLSVLDIRGNLFTFPLEIIEKYSKPDIILNYYFRYLRGESQKFYPVNEVKLLIVGQGSVGKTSLVERVLLDKFNGNQPKTEGISISQWLVPTIDEQETDSSVKINIWDFGGQEIMHATHQFFLTKRSLYLLVIDSRLTQEENRVEYWLKIIQSFGGESPVLIVGNKIDQHPLDIDRTGLQKKYSNIVGILETSAATGAGIEELKAAIIEQVNNLPHVRDLLPETWFTVKTQLEELGREKNYISHDNYLELCIENEVSDETSQRTLIGFLHDLGVVLHFQDAPRLEALGILNPQWVTNGVYKILNSHILFQNKGVLTIAMLDEILNLPEYPRGKRLFIIDMMKKFELCYDIEPDKTFLVPDLLPKDQPQLTFNGIPAFEYAYPVLPSSVITRFIVRMNQHICDGCVWRTGVLLQMGNNIALVKADIEDRKISIAIDGLEHTRRDALSAIRYQLDEIHASIKGLNPQKMVPIPNAPNAEPVEYEYLLMLERDGQEIYSAKDGNRLVKVNVRQLLSGIESESQRKEQGDSVTIYGDVYTGGGDFTGRDKSISASERSVIAGGDVKDSTIISGDENAVNK